MRTFLLFIVGICWGGPVLSQYWQQQVNYRINVALNDNEKTLDAFEEITYINNSPDTLHFIWFHLWPNAYRNDRTSFSEQLLENGNTKFYFSNPSQKGYINRLRFQVNGLIAQTENHPEYIDVVKLLLPHPLSPGDSAHITTPFHVKLPFNFSRGGYDGNSFQITQWYPKPAVYDRTGWHPMPYLDQGEYYSEFGNYEVHISLPSSYKVAATGALCPGSETEDRSVLDIELPWGRSGKAMAKGPHGKSVQSATLRHAEKTKELCFTQQQVHDFAWFANKAFVVESDTCVLPSGKTVQISVYYTPAQKALWRSNGISFAKEAIRFYSHEVHEYPYSRLSVVQGPASFGGGMEYPTITIISPTSSLQSLNETIVHEIGHNWFYGVIATNERDHPWMDEGINSFYDEKYAEIKYGHQPELLSLILQTKAIHRTDQAIENKSQDFSQLNYELVAYFKTAQFLRGLERRVGPDTLRKRMQAYYRTWKFRHPNPDDFKSIFLQGQKDSSLSTYFRELQGKGILPDDSLHGTSFISPLAIHSVGNYLLHPTKHAYIFSPAIGYNTYDRTMVGGVFTNYKLPSDPLQGLLIPLYATRSKRLTGMARLNLALYGEGPVRKTDIFINASQFSSDEMEDASGQKIFMHYSKIVPGVRLTLKESNPRSTVTRFAQWKTFVINEPGASMFQDTAVTNGDTSILFRVPYQSRYLNQLQLFYGNFRALYPYDFTFQVEQAKDFVRPTFAAHYFLNYASEGGLQVRLFAGKFLYLGGRTTDKEFYNDRYFLNLTGPNGAEDYTYHDYFVGRNAFDGFPSQQIMMRDGAFKIGTNLLIDKTGKTDNWLTAVNLTSSIPANINPLAVLPLKIPLLAFCDIGTYAERWAPAANGERFLFDAGLQIPLLKGVVNVYFPLFYSKTFKDYVKSYVPSPRFWRTLSFSIDLNSKQLKRINPEIEL